MRTIVRTVSVTLTAFCLGAAFSMSGQGFASSLDNNVIEVSDDSAPCEACSRPAKHDLPGERCKFVYREALQILLDVIKDFNDGRMNHKDVAYQFALTDSNAARDRAACPANESSSVKSCVKKYESLYRELRDKVDILAMLTANQTSIEFGVLERAKFEAAVIVTDLTCHY